MESHTLETQHFVLCREVVLFWKLFCIECINKDNLDQHVSGVLASVHYKPEYWSQPGSFFFFFSPSN